MQLVPDIFILQRYCVISAEDILRFCKYWVPTLYPDTSCMSISESNVTQTKISRNTYQNSNELVRQHTPNLFRKYST